MFFFIGGIQPKTVILENRPEACPSCGRFEVKLKRVDSYLSFFFIPIIRIKKGEPFIECHSCGSIYSNEEETYSFNIKRCNYCRKPVQNDHVFCPYCGHQL